jgi:MFS transporter, DHA1 family, inner membrane transport protein
MEASVASASIAVTERERTVPALAMYAVLLLSYVLMAADRYLLPVLATNVRQEFGFSLARIGLLTTIFTVGLGIGGLPTGYLLSRWPRKRVVTIGIAIFSFGIALTVAAAGFWTLLACLAITGIGMAMLATSMFALAASYFYRHRAAAIGSVNFCYGLGGIVGPILAGVLAGAYGSWRVPMLVFGIAGLVMIGLIVAVVRPWFSETRRASEAKDTSGGATTLLNRNTILLTLVTLIQGLVLYGFLGMYPTFLREALGWTPKVAGVVMSFFGLGALLSIGGGWLGDRLSPRVVLSGGFVCTAMLGYFFFHGTGGVVAQETLTFVYGAIGSAVLYVNLAGYHVKAVRSSLASSGSGMFVTSLYGSSAIAGYLMGWIANQAGWAVAGEIQMSALALVAAVLSLALRPADMAL